MIKHLNIKIFGRVQGVFFRATAKEEAEKLNLTGFAKNEPDGLVYIEIEGEKDKVDSFLDWCRNGSSMARVDKIETIEGEIKNFSSFEAY